MKSFRTNLDGTTSQAFSIGKRGLTIRQGADDPNIARLIGGSGDLYVRIGSVPRLYQFRLGSWTEMSDVFTRTVVATHEYSITFDDHYIGVRYQGAVRLYLPAGIANKKFVVKDELGNAASNPISIYAAQGETVDGQPGVLLNTNYGVATMVYGAEWHLI